MDIVMLGLGSRYFGVLDRVFVLWVGGFLIAVLGVRGALARASLHRGAVQWPLEAFHRQCLADILHPRVANEVHGGFPEAVPD